MHAVAIFGFQGQFPLWDGDKYFGFLQVLVQADAGAFCKQYQTEWCFLVFIFTFSSQIQGYSFSFRKLWISGTFAKRIWITWSVILMQIMLTPQDTKHGVHCIRIRNTDFVQKHLRKAVSGSELNNWIWAKWSSLGDFSMNIFGVFNRLHSTSGELDCNTLTT